MDKSNFPHSSESQDMLSANSQISNRNIFLDKFVSTSWILGELYNSSKNEMKDKFSLNEAYLLISAVGLIDEMQSINEYKRILTRAVLNASCFHDAGNF